MTLDSALEALLNSRFSCRAFLPDPVPWPVIARVLRLAQRTATWCNTQPWHLEYRGIYLDRRREAGFSLYQMLGIARSDTATRDAQLLENYRFSAAPHVVFVTSDEALRTYGAVDCGAYVANFLLAAQACGLSAIAPAAPARYSDFLRDYLGFGADRLFVCGLSLGYGDTAHRANTFGTDRADPETCVTWVTE
ncbi:MAG: nitroreductase [Reyranella sp.]